MRLINTKTFKLVELNDFHLPSYAILSHRWYAAGEEVTFQDLESGRDVSFKRGFAKLKSFCNLVYSLGFEYAWSDTCCINKDSATELGTALNSMFRWYAESTLCIAFLEDVTAARPLEKSEWFKRGWTLQELIAPTSMSFYDRDWQFVGSKIDLMDILSSVTRVQQSILAHTEKPERCSVAQRMSWAAGRITERIEDRAYSLLGLFDVTLEMVYGEREKAFIRLQEKIIQQTADQSIFTWSLDDLNHSKGYSGMLAPSPDSFAGCSNVIKARERTSFSLSNIGLSIQLYTLPYSMEIYLAYLDCCPSGNPDTSFAILISRLPSADQWARVVNHKGASVFFRTVSDLGWSRASRRQLYIRQVPLEAPICFSRAYGFWLRTLDPLQTTGQIDILSRVPTHSRNRVYLRPSVVGTAGAVTVKPFRGRKMGETEIRCIKVGFDDEFKPIFWFANDWGRTFNSMHFQDAATSAPGSSSHSIVFANDWLRDSRYRDGQVLPSAKDRWADGSYILVPDPLPKENECYIYYDLDGLNIRVELSLLPDHKQESRLWGSPLLPQYIWTLDLFKLDGPSPRSTYLRAQVKGAIQTFGSMVSAANEKSK